MTKTEGAMPIERMHRERKKKNFALFAALLGLVVILFIVSMLKFPQ